MANLCAFYMESENVMHGDNYVLLWNSVIQKNVTIWNLEIVFLLKCITMM